MENRKNHFSPSEYRDAYPVYLADVVDPGNPVSAVSLSCLSCDAVDPDHPVNVAVTPLSF